MRKILFLLLLVFITIGCTSQVPITPDPVEDPEPALTAQFNFPDQAGTEWEGIDTSDYQAKFVELGLERVMINRSAQGYEYDPEFIPDGTLMNAYETLSWVSGWVTNSTFGWGAIGEFTGCDVYITTYWQLKTYNDAGLPPPLDWAGYITFVFEMNGYDCPDEPDIEPCDYCDADYDSPFGDMVCMWQLE